MTLEQQRQQQQFVERINVLKGKVPSWHDWLTAIDIIEELMKQPTDTGSEIEASDHCPFTRKQCGEWQKTLSMQDMGIRGLHGEIKGYHSQIEAQAGEIEELRTAISNALVGLAKIALLAVREAQK